MDINIANTIELWEEIEGKRNFDEKGYDLELAKKLKKRLDLPTNKLIMTGIKDKSIQIEDFIKAFFEISEPFVDMMSDLLSMFQEIGAKQTDTNLNIKFNFDEGKKSLKLDLEEFKSYREKIVEINKICTVRNVDFKDLFELKKKLNSYLLQKYYLEYANEGTIEEWCKTYKQNEWPELDPSINNIKDTGEFKDLISEIFDIWTYIVGEIRRIKKNPKDNIVGVDSVSSNLNMLDLEDWPSQFLYTLDQIINDKSLSENGAFIAELKAFLNTLPMKQITKKEKLKQLKEFLKLPFWDKRYELYSVWVFREIYEATKKYNLEIHLDGDTLSFPFKETHLATIHCEDNEIFIFSEKKTPLVNPKPIGESRQNNIQPDYSFFLNSKEDISSSILEIECKQYKKPSNKNFASALIDYSNGRPKADVYVVNYGRISNVWLFKAVDKLIKKNSLSSNKTRCFCLGDLRPNNNQKEFEDIIQNKIKLLCKNKAFQFNSPFSIELKWAEPIKDLDLHCIFYDIENNEEKIDHRNLNIQDHMSLNHDARDSKSSPEIIHVNCIKKGVYHFYVDSFKNVDFDKNVVCNIYIGKDLIDTVKPKSYNGKYWDICKIDLNCEKYKLINKIYEREDFENTYSTFKSI